jgi:hypothetical protein
MAKHRKYSRRSQRRNRRASKKMRGGIGVDDTAVLEELGFNAEQIAYLLQNHPNIDILFFQNAINGVPGNIFFQNPQNPDDLIAELQAIDADVHNDDESLDTTREAISEFSNNELDFSDISSIYGDSDNELSDIYVGTSTNTDASFNGGKRKTLAKRTKRRTNKRKTKKSKKIRKNRKQKQIGGNGFTTTLSTPLEENKDNYDTYVRLGLREY